jgi:hypothetical protein
MAPQAQIDPKLAERKDEGLKPSEEVQKPGKHGPRKRVSQACDRCRSRKDKCDGKKPVRIPDIYHCLDGLGHWSCGKAFFHMHVLSSSGIILERSAVLIKDCCMLGSTVPDSALLMFQQDLGHWQT